MRHTHITNEFLKLDDRAIEFKKQIVSAASGGAGIGCQIPPAHGQLTLPFKNHQDGNNSSQTTRTSSKEFLPPPPLASIALAVSSHPFCAASASTA